MHLLLFEVTPFPERRAEYLEIAARLKPELEKSGGCRFIERFQNVAHPDQLLSFQLWEDDAAIAAWRMNTAHHDVQLYSRGNVFADYRLRVAAVQAGAGTEVTGAAARQRAVAVVRTTLPALPGSARGDLSVQSFMSLYREGQYLHLTTPAPAQLARISTLADAVPNEGCHVAIVTRDYGMFERGEAPQVCPVAGHHQA
jgi:heme-degrading monooxygenase HmoA